MIVWGVIHPAFFPGNMLYKNLNVFCHQYCLDKLKWTNFFFSSFPFIWIAPSQLSAPYTEGVNSTTMKISWNEPKELNGPPPIYQLERIGASLTASNVTVRKGIRFPGNGYYKFPSSVLPTNTYFTGKEVVMVRFSAKNVVVLSAA